MKQLNLFNQDYINSIKNDFKGQEEIKSFIPVTDQEEKNILNECLKNMVKIINKEGKKVKSG